MGLKVGQWYKADDEYSGDVFYNYFYEVGNRYKFISYVHDDFLNMVDIDDNQWYEDEYENNFEFSMIYTIPLERKKQMIRYAFNG